MKITAAILAGIFLWDQIALAGDLANESQNTVLPASFSRDNAVNEGFSPESIESRQTGMESLISSKQEIEDFVCYSHLQLQQEISQTPDLNLSLISNNGDIISYLNDKITSIETSGGTSITELTLNNDKSLFDADISYQNGQNMILRGGKIHSIANAVGDTFYYGRDGLLESIKYSDGRGVSWLYRKDADGNILETVLRDNEKKSYYDTNGILQKVEFNTGKTIEYTCGIVSKIRDTDTTIYIYQREKANEEAPVCKAILKEIQAKGNQYYVENGNITSLKLSDGTLIRDFHLGENGKITAYSVVVNTNGEEREYQYIESDSGGIIIKQGQAEYCYDNSGNLIKFIDERGTYLYLRSAWGVYEGALFTGNDGTIRKYDAGQNLEEMLLTDGTKHEYNTIGDFKGKIKKTVYPDKETFYYEYRRTDAGNLEVLKRRLYDKDYDIFQRYSGCNQLDRSLNPKLISTFKLEGDKTYSSFLAKAYYNGKGKSIDLGVNITGSDAYLDYRIDGSKSRDYRYERLQVTVEYDVEYTVEYVWEDESVKIYLFKSSMERPKDAVFSLSDTEWDPKFYVQSYNANGLIDSSSSGGYMETQAKYTNDKYPFIGDVVQYAKVSFSDNDSLVHVLCHTVDIMTDTFYKTIWLTQYGVGLSLEVKTLDYRTQQSCGKRDSLNINLEAGTTYIIKTIQEDNDLKIYLKEQGAEEWEMLCEEEGSYPEPQINTFVLNGVVQVEARDHLEIYEYEDVSGNLIKRVQTAQTEVGGAILAEDEMMNTDKLVSPSCDLFPENSADLDMLVLRARDFSFGLPSETYNTENEIIYDDNNKGSCPITNSERILERSMPELPVSLNGLNDYVRNLVFEIGEIRVIAPGCYERRMPDGTIYEYNIENGYVEGFGELTKRTRPDKTYTRYKDYYADSDQAENYEEYDERGKIIETAYNDIFGKCRLKARPDFTCTEYLYDGDDKLVSKYEYSSDGKITVFDSNNTEVYAYDPKERVNDNVTPVLLTNEKGDVIEYVNGKIDTITFKENGIKIRGIEMDTAGNLDKGIIEYTDDSEGVIYDGKLIQKRFTSGNLVRYREGQIATEYSQDAGLLSFNYVKDKEGTLLYIKVTGNGTVSMYNKDGQPISFTGADGEVLEYENGRIKKIITKEGTEHFYAYVSEEDCDKAELVGTTSDTTLPKSVFYNKETGSIEKIINITGEVITFAGGLLTSITAGVKTALFDYAVNDSEGLEKVIVDRDGIKRIYNAKGELSGLNIHDQTNVIYEDGKLSYIEKSDGTKITDAKFTANGELSEAMISYPDGSLAVYKDGEILESITAFGDKVKYLNGKINTVTLNDESVFEWSYECESIKIYDRIKEENRWYEEGLLRKREELTGAELTTNYYYNSEGSLSHSTISRDSDILYGYSYTYENKLTIVTDEDGNVQAYNKDKKLIYIIDSHGRKCVYTYVDRKDDYIEVWLPDLSKTKYDTKGNIIEIINPDGTVIKDIIFDDKGDLESFTYIKDAKTHIFNNGRLQRVITGDGREIVYGVSGFAEYIETGQGKEEYGYIVDYEKEITLDAESCYSADNIEFKNDFAQIKTPFNYGNGKDGALVVEAWETVYIDGTKEYESIYVAKGGRLVLEAWDGTSGGLAILKSKGPVVIEGQIVADGKGFRGGINNPELGRWRRVSNYTPNQSGESYSGLGEENSDPNHGGGGSGCDAFIGSQYPCGGGAGGGYGTDGYQSRWGVRGTPGKSYGKFEIDELYRGSGGGAGGDYTLANCELDQGNDGGAGGGAVRIIAPTIKVSGGISADGDDGQGNDPNCNLWGAGGGGGSGGTIWLSGEKVDLRGSVLTVTGGRGGKDYCRIDGGGGGYGRMRIDYKEISGSLPNISTLYTTQIKESDIIKQAAIISNVIQTDALEYDNVSWNQDMPEGTEINLYTRTGNTAQVDSAWSAWSEVFTNSIDSKITSPEGKYIQIKTEFWRGNSDIVPKILMNEQEGLTLSYTKHPEAAWEIANLKNIICVTGSETKTYDRFGIILNNSQEIIDLKELVYDYEYLSVLKNETPGYKLNETQKTVYLNNEVVIAELEEIKDVTGTRTTYVQGQISEINFNDSAIAKDVEFDSTGKIDKCTYIANENTYLIKESRIDEVITSQGARVKYNEEGLATCAETATGDIVEYEYFANEKYTTDKVEELIFEEEKFYQDEISAKLDILVDYGTGKDGILEIKNGETVHVDGLKEYESIYVAEGGKLVLEAWDGTRGGLAIIRSQGPVVVEGIIDAGGAGYRGGVNNPEYGSVRCRILSNYAPNQAGESISGLGEEGSYPNFGGGGGGHDAFPGGVASGGGGGGGFGTDGYQPMWGVRGDEGKAYGAYEVEILYRGSGGGAGGDYTSASCESAQGNDGGAGGGALHIIAPSIEIEGHISADGADGGGNEKDCHTRGTGGGGGSGGTLWLTTEKIIIKEDGRITVNGGKGGTKYCAYEGGGAGGYGRMRVDYEDLDGTLPKIPTLYTTYIEKVNNEGGIISRIIETGAIEYGTISWKDYVPEGADITVETRTGDIARIDSTWSTWSEPVHSCEDITSPAGKYIQYKILFTTKTTGVNPVLYLNEDNPIEFSYIGNLKTAEESEKIAYVKIKTNGKSETYDAGGINIRNPADKIDLSLLMFSAERTREITERVEEHQLNSSQKVITIYDKTNDTPIQTVSRDHSITYFKDGLADKVEDKNGALLVEYTYDDDNRLLKTGFIEAREKLEEECVKAREDLVTQREDALIKLEQAAIDGKTSIAQKVKDIQAQITSERARLLTEKAKYDPVVYDLSEFDKVFREIDEYEKDLYVQEKQAYVDLEKRIVEARANIEKDTESAMRKLLEDDYITALGDICQKESSPVIYYYYRNVLGRDPDAGELEYWLDKAKEELKATEPEKIISHIQSLAEYGQRQTWKQNIITDVSLFFNQFFSATDEEKEIMFKTLGLSMDEVSPSLRGSDPPASLRGPEGAEAISTIISWLNSQSLHFGDSAFKTIIELLEKQGTIKTFDEIGQDCIKIDILTGVITSQTRGDLVISMNAMTKVAEAAGLVLYSEKIDFKELKRQLEINSSIILHVNGNHYVLLKEINEDKAVVTYEDLSVGKNGQAMTMSRSEFMSEWKGFALSKNKIEPANDNCRYLNISQAKNIRGSGWWQKFWKGIVLFFQKIVAPVATVLLFIPGMQAIGAIALGINIMIQTISYVVRTGTLMDVIWSVGTCAAAAAIGTVANVIGPVISSIGESIANTITPAIHGAFTSVMPIFETITNAVSNISTGIGHIFTPIVGEGIAANLATTVISTAVDIGTNYLFKSLNLDPTLASIGSALMTGLFIGMADTKIDAIASMLRSGTIKTGRIIGDAVGLDPEVTSLLALTAGSIIGAPTEAELQGIARNLAQEAAYLGVQDLGEHLNLDPRISYLAGIGIRSSLQVGFSSGGNPKDIWDAAMNGLARGITNVGLEWAAQEIGITPLLASLITTAGTGALEAFLEGRNPLTGIYDSYFRAGTGLLTLGGPGATPWEQACYISQILDFSDIIRERGIVDALETYAAGFLQQTTINNIWKLGGIYDLLMNQDQIEFVTQPDGTDAKRIYTNAEKTDYIELALDDDRLIGKKEGNIVMHCEFVKGPDGQFKLKNGDVDVYGPDGTTIIRQESIRDFKLVKILRYGQDGQMYEAIVTIDGESIQLDNQGRVLHGKRFNFIDNVITDYKDGSVTKIEMHRVYVPSEIERQEYIDKGYTDEDLRNFEMVYIYDASDVAHSVKATIKDSNGKLIESTLLNNKAKSIWEHAVKIMTSGEAATYITLDKEKGVANVDMELTYPEAPTNKEDELEILGPAYDLARYIAGNHADWHMAVVDAIPEVGAIVANRDAQFVFIAGINDTGKTTAQLQQMKDSLQTNKTVVVGHSAGTETAIRSAFCAKADKYIIASPRMTPEKFYAIMQESGVKPEQVIIVSTKGDFYNWGWTYEDRAPNKWNCIYIESGPGVSISKPWESHCVPIDGWLSGGTYTVRVNGSGPINTTLANIYSVKVNEEEGQ